MLTYNIHVQYSIAYLSQFKSILEITWSRWMDVGFSPKTFCQPAKIMHCNLFLYIKFCIPIEDFKLNFFALFFCTTFFEANND